MTDLWPWHLLRPANVVRRLRARTTVGTTSASGFTQRVSVPAHAWVIEYSGIVIWTDEQLAAWDSVEASLDGAANPIYVPLIGDYYGDTPGSFSFPQAAGSMYVSLTRFGAPIKAGYHFGFGDGRLHRVWAIDNVVGDVYSAHVRPAFREAVPVDTPVTFNWPYCKCRLASDDEMNLTITPGRFATGAVKFIEDPN